MIINKANLVGVFRNLNTAFNKSFADTQTQWAMTAMKIPTTTLEVQYNWLSRFPQMQKWLGDKQYKSLAAFKYSIINEPYEATIAVKRREIETDTLGMIGINARETGQAAAEWPDNLISALKNGAFTSLCYDGQYFYDTDHPVNGVSTSNLGTKALSAATTAAAAASYGVGRLAMMTLKDDENRPLVFIPDTLEVPPALETTANILMNSDKLTDQSPNPFKGQCKVIVNPRLTSATAWFLHVTTRALKPFIFQELKKPMFVQQTDMASDDVYNRGEYKFGVEADGAAGYGLWQLSYGSTGAS